MLNNGGLRINPCQRPLETPQLSSSAVFSARLWELQSVGISNALTPCLLRAAGIAKTLTQVSYLSAVTSLADRGNLKNTDVPRSLFCKMVLIDINDISPLQTLSIKTGHSRSTPSTDWCQLGWPGHPVYSMEGQAWRQRWDPRGSPRDLPALIRRLLTQLICTHQCVGPAD